MLTINRQLLAFIIPAALMGALVLLVTSRLFELHTQSLDLATTLDFTLTIPAVYFLLIRKTSIPKLTTVPVFILGVIVTSYVLPQESQSYLTIIKTWAIPVVELTVFSIILTKVIRLIRSFRSTGHSADFYSTLKIAATEVFPGKMSHVFAMEIAMIYYSLFSWKKKKLNENEFSYHKEQSSQMLLGVFIFLIGIETFAVHILLINWSVVATWVLTILSAYTMLQLLAIAKSLGKRPHHVTESGLILAYGIASETKIPFGEVESIEWTTKEMEENPKNRYLSFLKVNEGHNVVLTVKNEQVLEGFYGLKKKYKRIAFHVDQKEEFRKLVDTRIS